MAMLMPSEHMLTALNEYEERRKTFREWLQGQLVPGVHYGVPPGCEPPTKRPDPKQWQYKPSLYKAGADFICDLMAARDEYEPDMLSWELSGKLAGLYPFICRLHSRNGDLLGEGRGAAIRGKKSRDDNAAIKCGKKCAKVDAVINSWGLSDLFTQDAEDLTPDAIPRKPQRAPVDKYELTALWTFWKSQNEHGTAEAFRAMLHGWTDIPEDKLRDPKLWDRQTLEMCQRNLGMTSEDGFSV
jgi:hypothetical protein